MVRGENRVFGLVKILGLRSGTSRYHCYSGTGIGPSGKTFIPNKDGSYQSPVDDAGARAQACQHRGGVCTPNACRP